MIPQDIRQLRLLQAADVVQREVRIIDVSRRNRNLAVHRSKDAFLYKRGSPSSDTVTREERISELIHRRADSVSAHVPRAQRHAYADVRLQYFPEAQSINQVIEDTGAFPLHAATGFGLWLGRMHAAERLRSGASALPSRGEIPWALSLDRPGTELFLTASGATLRLLEIIGEQTDICVSLRELRSAWRREALVHNDLKWDNVMLTAPSERGADHFLVIDWELAGLGDPRWDVGSVMAAYLALWAGSIPVMRDAPADYLLGLAEQPLHSLQPAARAFLLAYLDANRPAHGARPELDWIMRYCGARLIQYAVERAQLRASIAADSVVLLQVAQNVMRFPRQAGENLLALPAC